MSEVKVLIYSGEGVGQHCLPGTENALDKANIPGYTFKHAREDEFNATTMKGFDVIFLPGGNSARVMYKDNPNIDVKELRKYPTVGICSAGYIESLKVVQPDGSKFYDAWGVTPHVTAINYAAEGVVNIMITEEGEAVLGVRGIIPMDHENGPAFRLTSGVVLATYADGPMAGKPAIVMDTDSTQNHILSGPHPELEPFYPDIVGRMAIAAYLGNKGGDKMNVKIVETAETSDRVATFIKNNKRLPNYASLNNTYLSMVDFLYLMVSSVINISNGQLNDIEMKEVEDAPAPSASYTSGKLLTKEEYIQVAKNIQSFIITNGRAPNNATTSIGKLATNDLVYDYSLILSFYKANKRLPNYVTINQISNGGISGGSLYDMFVDGTDMEFDTITEFYNDVIIPHAVYSDPMYFNNLKTPRQAMQAIINNVKGIYNGEANQNNCCDFAGLIALLAKEKGYGEYGKDIVLYGFRCPSYDCYHAVVLLSTKEFAGDTVQVRDYQYGDILTKKGAIIDGAAGAADRYQIKKYWCEATNKLAYKEPNWLPYEYL